MAQRMVKRQFITQVGFLIKISPKEPESHPERFWGLGKQVGRYKGRFDT